MSCISLSGVKAPWSGWMSLPNTTFNLFTKTFEIILWIVEQRLIGRKWFDAYGFSILGIKAIKVWFTSFKSFPEWKKAFTAFVTELPTIGQNFWKKKGGYPSGPGALSGSHWKIASLISWLDTGLMSSKFSSSEIKRSRRLKSIKKLE